MCNCSSRIHYYCITVAALLISQIVMSELSNLLRGVVAMSCFLQQNWGAVLYILYCVIRDYIHNLAGLDLNSLQHKDYCLLLCSI